jgi:predicted nucleotidyltransferase
MLERLFSSKIRIRLLALFVTHPRDEFYIRQIQKLTGENFNNIRRELMNLKEAGILKSILKGNLKYFWINQAHPLYIDLKNIIYKTEGLGNLMRTVLRKVKGIKSAFIYGSVSKNKERENSDIDLMVIGDVSLDKIYSEIRKVESKLKREINIDVISPDEWIKRKQKRDSYILDILKNKRIFILGNENEL